MLSIQKTRAKSMQIAPIDEREKLKKYFFDYLVELSRFDPTIMFDEQGDPIYEWYDLYWVEAERYPLTLYIGGKFAGFALVWQTAPTRYEIAEFYVIPEFRGTGVAVDFAVGLTKLFCGELSISTRTENQRAVKFWDKFARDISTVLP